MLRIHLVAAVAALCVTSAATAQGTIPELRVGTPATGRLPSDSAHVTYRFVAAAGDRLRLAMRSDSFDTVVEVGRLQDGEWVSVDTNDDADGTNSRLSLVMGAAGEYRIRAKAYEEGSEGPFTLDLTSESDPTCCAPALGVAVDYPGSLDDDDRAAPAGERYEPYLLHGRAGEEWIVTMRSTAFAPQLHIGRWTGGAFQELVAGAPSAGSSRAVIRFPADGEYLIMASANDAAARGNFRIVVDRSR